MTLYPRYKKYKPTSCAWLAEIPEHWKIKRVKNIATYNDEVLDERTDPDFEIEYVDISSVTLTNGIQKTETMPFEKSPSRARRKVKDGDIIVSTVRTYLKAIASISDPPENMIVSTGFAVIRPKENFHSGFAGYLLQSNGFVGEVVANSVGVSYPAINASDLVRIPAVEPPLEEQQAIARFLDFKTAQIDTLIAKQQTLLDKLIEKRTAIISHAISKGVDSQVEVKNSGVEWLGNIPAHWEVKRIKNIATYNDEALDERTDPDFEIDYVDISSVTLTNGIQKTETMPFEKSPSRARRKVKDGDIIVSTVRTYLKAIASISDPPENMIVSTGFAVIRPKENFHSGFAGYLLQSNGFVGEVVANSVGVSYPAINASDLVRIPAVEPPLEEQQAIARFLDFKTAQIDAQCQKINEVIFNLQEYRSSLITNTVTGKIDVRGVQIPQPAKGMAS
ncbi:restriction endonuclease subunit S [Burkholderia ambifaria]|uniref:restriction endonuclease subunit S n=1 Tax=Burkholderia ambifaria TaxID=152480 RepID=UPI00158CF7E9|nr:restriction endonuclease subunit S [Burkholderia ambifaria]